MQPRRVIFGIQDNLNTTRRNMAVLGNLGSCCSVYNIILTQQEGIGKNYLNSFENGRCPSLFSNGRQPNFIENRR